MRNSDIRFIDCLAVNAGGSGFSVEHGEDIVFENCRAINNQHNGFEYVPGMARFKGCEANGNGLTGFKALVSELEEKNFDLKDVSKDQMYQDLRRIYHSKQEYREAAVRDTSWLMALGADSVTIVGWLTPILNRIFGV